jgi:hypothetical protein
MKSSTALRFLALAFILSASSGPVSAGWVEYGFDISTGSSSQYSRQVIKDGEGGMIVTWMDYRSGNADIYAQRVDSYGNLMWEASGVPVCADTNSQSLPVLATDGEGGAIIAWIDSRNGLDNDIYAQRVSAEGVVQWVAGGREVSGADNDQNYPKMISDNEGGAIITWQDGRNGNLDIYAQRISGTGSRQWTISGVPVCLLVTEQHEPIIVSASNHKAIIAWEDERNGTYDIYIQRLEVEDGDYDWDLNGNVVCDAASTQRNPVMTAGLSGDAILAWEDNRNGNMDIYASRISNWGISSWGTNGIAVCDHTASSYLPAITSNGGGGAYIAWEDWRSGTDYDIYAAKLDVAGSLLWTADGILIGDGYLNQDDVRITADGEGGFIAVYDDDRLDNRDLTATRVSSSGTELWGSHGIFISREYEFQGSAQIVSDDAGGVYAAWTDQRYAADVYVQRIERNGYWGYPAPEIESIRDVPDDEGGYVNLAWNASRLDPWPDEEISEYSIWRAIDETAALSAASSGLPLLAGPDRVGLDMQEGAIRAELLAGEQYYWQLITTVDAYHLETYARQTKTSSDSMDASAEYNYYQIIAHSTESDYWISQPDSGRSVDDLAPALPLGLEGEQVYSPEGLQLTWDPNSESDLAGYNIYRGTSSGFEPGPGNLVATTPDTLVFDGDWNWAAGYWYKVAAVDIHGNESPYALTGPDAVTGDEPATVPDATFLAQNFPNPFNPSTTIKFGLKEKGHVSLRIYDASGRLVGILIDESKPAGRHTAEWSGKDLNGSPVASGVYFYMLKAGLFEETRKMVLLR